MANTVIQVKKSGVTSNTPADLNYGELAINYADGKLFYKDSLDGISSIENQDTFNTIVANNQVILATTPGETLEMVPGTNITMDVDTGNNKITINSTASGGTPAGGNQQLQYNNNGSFGASSGLYYDGTSLRVTSGNIESLYSNGNEGGEFRLATAATNTTLEGGSIAIDIYQNKLRFFEAGGGNRGAFIDLSAAGAGVSSDLLAGGGGGSTTDTYARNTANAAFIQANTAVSNAAGASLYANGAFTKANTAVSDAAGASLYANGAFTKANTANITYTTSATSPANPKLGDIWFNTNDNLKYEYATDGTTSFWWDTDSIYSGAAYTANTTAPIAPRLGDIWYNTTEDIPYIFSSDGTSTFWWDMQSYSTPATPYVPITKRDTTTASISISNGYITITNRGGATVNVATY